jgi:hypothetical protein
VLERTSPFWVIRLGCINQRRPVARARGGSRSPDAELHPRIHERLREIETLHGGRRIRRALVGAARGSHRRVLDVPEPLTRAREAPRVAGGYAGRLAAVIFYGIASSLVDEVIEFYPSESAATAALAAIVGDAPELADVLRVEKGDFDVASAPTEGPALEGARFSRNDWE